MKAREYVPNFVIISSAILVMSCLLPGMIPLTRESEAPMPTMEKNADTVIEVLYGRDWQPLQGLARERYTEEDFARHSDIHGKHRR